MGDILREVETSQPLAGKSEKDKNLAADSDLARNKNINAGAVDTSNPDASQESHLNLPKLSLVTASTQPPGLAADRLKEIIPSKTIEVPASEELDSPDWHKHDHEPKKGLPGEYLTRTAPRTPADSRVLAAFAKINPDEIKRSLEEISGEREVTINGKTVKLESRSTYDEGYKLALDYFKEKFEKEGYVVTLDTYTRRGKPYYNLRATKVGNQNPNEIVMYGAHIDSTAGYPWGHESKAPGANDDGSGSVALWQIARAMKDLPLDKTVVFSLFSGEEQGLWGSRAMAEVYKQAQEGVKRDLQAGKLSPQEANEKAPKVIAMYQLDMIGYAPDSNTVESHDTTDDKAAHELTEVLADVQRQYNIDLKVYGAHNEELTNRSDHYPFYRNGIPAVLLTEPYDTAKEPNPAYHSRNDRVNLVNIPYMANVSKLALAAGVELAGLKNAAPRNKRASSADTIKSQVLEMMPLHARIVNY